MGELKKVFRPEFLNRIDEVIVFHKLAKDEIKEIVELLLKRVRESLAERELSLNLSEDAADLLVEKGWDPSMGARPLRRAIQRYIEDPLADEVLAQNAPAGLHRGGGPGARADADGGEGEATSEDVKITITAPKARKREPVGVGAKGGEAEGDEGDSAPEGGAGLPDEPEVLPDVPDAPPASDEDSEPAAAVPGDRTAVVVVDMLNAYDFDDAEALAANAEGTIEPIKKLLDEHELLIYVNDNYGDWNSSQEELAQRALDGERPDLVEPILPPERSKFVLKARHSIFYGTPLDYLLYQENVGRLVLCGQVTEQCILYSALDAHVRHHDVVVPRDAVACIHEHLADAALEMMERNMGAEVI